jgi:hypothetical protein
VITLSFHPSQNRYYSTRTIVGETNARFLFGNGWCDYFISNDTLYITKVGNNQNEIELVEVSSASPRWLLTKHSETKLQMKYYGELPADARIVPLYIFNRKK